MILALARGSAPLLFPEVDGAPKSHSNLGGALKIPKVWYERIELEKCIRFRPLPKRQWDDREED